MAHILEKPKTDRSPKRYVVRYRVDGQWRGKTFVRKEDALRYKATMEADLARGDWLDPKLAKTPFSQVAAVWFATNPGGKAKTRAGYAQLLKNHVGPFFDDIPVARITKTTVRTWLNEMIEKGASPSVIRNAYRTVLKPILDTAVEQNLIRSNPLSTGERIKLPRSEKDEALFLTADQVELLADEMAQPFGTLIRFAAYTGLRAGEILRSAGQEPRPHAEGRPRQRVRHAPTAVRLRPDQDLRPAEGQPAELPCRTADGAHRRAVSESFVFRSPNRPRLVYGTFYSATFRPAVVRALPESLHGLRFHDLRHTAAALMVNLAGADAYLVMRRMGHSSITVTYDRYAKLFPERDAEIIAGLEAGRNRALAEAPSKPRRGRVPALAILPGGQAPIRTLSTVVVGMLAGDDTSGRSRDSLMNMTSEPRWRCSLAL